MPAIVWNSARPRCRAGHGLKIRATEKGRGSMPGQARKYRTAAGRLRCVRGMLSQVTHLQASQTVKASSHIWAHAGRSKISVISVNTEISLQKNLLHNLHAPAM